MEASGGSDSLYEQAVGPAMPSEIKLPRGGFHELTIDPDIHKKILLLMK